MKISVIVPSRLAVNPAGVAAAASDVMADPKDRELYLERALMSVKRQALPAGCQVEMVVGLDAGAVLPARFGDVRSANSDGTGQAKAVNAAVAASTGDVLAFLEDDDVWAGPKLSYQLPLLDSYAFVSSNQREVDESGAWIRTNDFATPSGWVMPRTTWDAVGPMLEGWLHCDTEWLGRLNATGLRRVHLVEKDAPMREWIVNVARRSQIGQTRERDPLVTRTHNPRGGMASIASGARLEQSQDEHAIMTERFGAPPW